MSASPNFTNTPVDAVLNMTAAMGTAVQALYVSPTVGQTQPSGTGTITFAGGAKITRLYAINRDTATASVYLQVSKLVGGISSPIGDPIAIPVATAKGAINSNAVDLLTALYGPGGAMNLAPGTTLQVALSVAIGAAGLSVVAEGAAF